MRHVSTEHAPAPGGHYAQGVVHQGTLYVSGQLPIDPRTGEKRLGPLEEQARQALENMLAVVRAAGADVEDVLKVTIYVSDMDGWGKVNQVFSELFGEHRPARAVVPTPPLHYGFGVEVEAVARVP